MVDKLGAAIYQRLARSDDGHVGLGVLTPVLKRIEQPGIHSSQAGQVLGVYLVGLLLGGVDESQFASIGHKDLVTTLFQEAANPRRVGSVSIAMRSGRSEAKRRLRASGVVRSLP